MIYVLITAALLCRLFHGTPLIPYALSLFTDAKWEMAFLDRIQPHNLQDKAEKETQSDFLFRRNAFKQSWEKSHSANMFRLSSLRREATSTTAGYSLILEVM